MPIFNLRQKIFIGTVSAVALIASVGISYRFFLMIYRKKYLAHRSFINRVVRFINEATGPDNPSIVHLTTKQSRDICSVHPTAGDNYISIRQLNHLNKKMDLGKLQKNNPFLPPFEPGQFITDLGKTHRLLVNKFMLAEKHVLVVTKIYEPQFADLTDLDLGYAYEIAFGLDGFSFYNSDKKSGASQKHKHMQIIPYSSVSIYYLDKIKAIVNNPNGNILKEAHGIKYLSFPFLDKYKHCLVKFDELNTKDQDLKEYSKYLKSVHFRVMQELKNEKLNQSYNLIYGKNWMLAVLRKKELILDAISVNALGCLGSILVKSEELFNDVVVKTPEDIFDEILVDKDDANEYLSSLEM